MPTTINTGNALGAKVLHYLPLNGTEGDVKTGNALTLGAGGSYGTDATYGTVLVSTGTAVAAQLTMDLSAKKDITIACRVAVDAFTNSDGRLFQFTPYTNVPLTSANGFHVSLDGSDSGATIRSACTPNGESNLSRNYSDAGYHYLVIRLSRTDGMVLCSVDGTALGHYYNNVQTAADNFANSVLTLMGHAGGRFLQGKIQKLAVFDGLLSDSEITALTADPDQIATTTTSTNTMPNSGNPTINGTPQVGTAIGYTPGAATGTPTPTITQRWSIDGVEIPGATAATYTPVTGDVGKALTVKQSSTNSEGVFDAISAPVTVTSATVTPTAPGAPTNVVATPGNGNVSVAFTAPASNGGAAITNYTVTLSTGQTNTGTSSPIVVTCPNGTPVTATVRATNSAGTSAASAASSSVTPADPSAPGSHSLTMTGATYGAGKFGQALTAGYGSGSSPLPADLNQTYHVEFWFKFDNGAGKSNDNVLISQRNAIQVALDWNSNPNFRVGSAGNGSSYRSYFNNVWRHGYFVVKPTSATLFVDGEGITGTTYASLSAVGYDPAAYPLFIGRMWDGTGQWPGQIEMVSVGSGDKYANGVVIPDAPVNTKQGGMSAIYLLDGDGVDSAGLPSAYANGSVASQDLQGQTLTLSGPIFNAPTSGRAYLIPSPGNPDGAEPKYAAITITGSTWTAVFENIVPGNYIGPKLIFANGSGDGVPLYGDAFSIIAITGGGDLSGGAGGGVLQATALVLSGATSGLVGEAKTITVSTDNPLQSGQSQTVTLTSPSGTFNPSQVTISASVASATTQYTPTATGAHTLTANATGTPVLPSATRVFTSSVVVATPGAAPTVGIATADANVLNGKTATISGPVNLQTDGAGRVDVFLDPQPSGTPVALGVAPVASGIWTKQAIVAPGLYKLRVVATANGQTATASTGNLRVLGLTGTVGIPVA